MIYKFEEILNNKELLKPYKSKDLISLYCDCCGTIFGRSKREIQKKLIRKSKRIVCSRFCFDRLKCNGKIVKCANCEREVYKQSNHIKNAKNNFCSLSCTTQFRNKNEPFGIVRSKLEQFLYDQIKEKYPQLNVLCNSKQLGFELDLFIPEINLAFELNGIFHYQPIFGIKKLERTKIIDEQKIINSASNGIKLIVIDTSEQRRFTEKSSEKYLDIVLMAIEERLSQSPLTN